MLGGQSGFSPETARSTSARSEFAIARLRPTQVEEFERAGRPGAASVRHAVDHIDAYLAACQLGITVASLGLGVVGEPVFEELFHGVLGDAAPIAGFGLSAVLAFALITLLHVVVGELSPKSLAIARTSSTVLWVEPGTSASMIARLPCDDRALADRCGEALRRRASPRQARAA